MCFYFLRFILFCTFSIWSSIVLEHRIQHHILACQISDIHIILGFIRVLFFVTFCCFNIVLLMCFCIDSRLSTEFILIIRLVAVFVFVQICRFVSIQIQCRFNDFSTVNVADPNAWLFQTFDFCKINCRLCHRQ
jgi:hypothetical protein